MLGKCSITELQPQAFTEVSIILLIQISNFLSISFKFMMTLC
jgi:hypothetical protein